ncbi:MAG: pentapeptide repeat-containing protein [Methanothrix sp.]
MSCRILVCALAVLLMIVAGAAEPTRVVQAEEILKKIELGEPVEYDNVIVEGDLDLSELDLPREMAERTKLEELLGWPDYEIVVVSSPINIINSVIKGSVNLNRTVFQNAVNFRGTIFRKSAFMIDSRFNRNAFFWWAQFNQTADFHLARFNQIVDFRWAQFNQTADFRSAQFRQESHFEDAGFFDLFFDESEFHDEAFLNSARIDGTLSLYRTKYDTLSIRWSSIHDLAYDDTAYHLLIQNFNKLGFSDDAQECQYSYRCKHREELFRKHKFDRWLFDLLAYATYGYGLRPVRPLGWAALFILVGGLFFFLTGSVSRSKVGPSEKKPLALHRRVEKPDGKVSIWEALLLSATYFTSGASSIISATPSEFVPVGPGRYVVVLLRLLGWIFFVLFLSSLTRTI